jgi:hypothetical protein
MKALLLLSTLLLMAVALPVHAVSAPPAAPDLSVANTGRGNVLSWVYPSGVSAKSVDSIEIWRFDGLLSSATFVEKAHGKQTTFKDVSSKDPHALYTIRYTLKTGEQSLFSDGKSAEYPYCPVLIVGLSYPFVHGPYQECYLPPPYSDAYWPTVQYVVGQGSLTASPPSTNN